MFSREALGAIEDLTEAAWARSVVHPGRLPRPTTPIARQSKDDLVVEPLVDDAQCARRRRPRSNRGDRAERGGLGRASLSPMTDALQDW